MKIEKKKIKDLIPAFYNPRRSTPDQEKNLAESLRKFGVVEPIVWNKQTKNVVGGHFRLRELEKLGFKEVDCVIVDLSLDDEKELNIRLNANTGEWDLNSLGEHFDLDLIQDWGFDMPEEFKEQEPLEAVEDDFESEPIEQIKTGIKHGDIIQIGPNRLMCGDSTELADVERLMDGAKADMVFTDPPYGVSYVSRVDESGRKNWGEIKNDSLSGDELLDFLIVALAPHKTPIKYICCNWQSFPDFYKAYGKPNSLIVWDKESIGLGAGYRSQHEFILFYGTLDHNSESNVWKCKRETTSEYVHLTQKPINIPARAIKNSSKEKQIVADPFLGSGSTMVACHQLKRVCYGMELEPKYCQVIIDRMKKLDPEIKIAKI